MAGTATRTKRTPTQADIIHTMLVQAEAQAQERLQRAISIPRSADYRETLDRDTLVNRYKVERDTVRALKERTRRYLDGDLTALYG